jgi:hypothetical protein
LMRRQTVIDDQRRQVFTSLGRLASPVNLAL